LGAVLDPMADRLYIFAALLGLAVRDAVPWWLMAVLVLRDLLMVGALPVLRHYGYGPLPVNFAGKAATLCLLYSFPLLFVAGYGGVLGDIARIVGWAFAIWGTAIYWWAGLLYAVQGLRLIRQARRADRAAEGTDPAAGTGAPGGPGAAGAERTARGPAAPSAGAPGPRGGTARGVGRPPRPPAARGHRQATGAARRPRRESTPQGASPASDRSPEPHGRRSRPRQTQHGHRAEEAPMKAVVMAG